MSKANPGFEAVANSISARQGVPVGEARAMLASGTRGASKAAYKKNSHLKRVKKYAPIPSSLNEEELSKIMAEELDDFAKALDALPLIDRTSALIKYQRMCATGEMPLAKGGIDPDDAQDANVLAPALRDQALQVDQDVLPGDADDKAENEARAAAEAKSKADDLAQAKTTGKANSGNQGSSDIKEVAKAEEPKKLKKVNAFRPLLSSLVANINAHVAASGGDNGTAQPPDPQVHNATQEHAPKAGANPGTDPGSKSAFGRPDFKDKNGDGYNEAPKGGVTPDDRDKGNTATGKTEAGPGFDPDAAKKGQKPFSTNH